MIKNILSEIRQFFLKLKHINTTFYNKVIIDEYSTFDKNTVLFKNVKITNSKIGRYTYIQENTCVINSIIGPFCSITLRITSLTTPEI